MDGLRGPDYVHRPYEAWEVQQLQYWQDKTKAAVMILEFNAKIVKALQSFYSNLITQKDFPDTLKTACENYLYTFFSQLDEIIGDFDMQITRAKLLVNTISDRKELVLQHLQDQASERTEQLNKTLQREAAVMRIITVVTLLYLPATFVSVSSPCQSIRASQLTHDRLFSAPMLLSIKWEIRDLSMTRVALSLLSL